MVLGFTLINYLFIHCLFVLGSTRLLGEDSAGLESDLERRMDITPPSIPNSPVMPGRLRARLDFWRWLGAGGTVMNWLTLGFVFWFSSPPPFLRKDNQPSCFDPPAQFDFVSHSVRELKARQVIKVWDFEAWGAPHVISPLKVVDKKGGKFRLILDLSSLNDYVLAPKFKYELIDLVPNVFDLGDFLFSWDLRDGYWHIENASETFTYMCFEWLGVVYYFAVLPFGASPACWVFTKVMKVLVRFWRSRGLKVMHYIDDGLGGAQPLGLALSHRDLVVWTLEQAGWLLNYPKSRLAPSYSQVHLGFLINLDPATGTGLKSASPDRSSKLRAKLKEVLARRRSISPRSLLQLAGYLVSLRFVLDPMALLFTKAMYRFVEEVRNAYSYDYRQPLPEGAIEEVKVWLDFYDSWESQPLWLSDPPSWVQAQDASGTGVGGWLTRVGGAVDLQAVAADPCPLVSTFGPLSVEARLESSCYRELYAIYYMFLSHPDLLAGSSITVNCDNQGLYFICKRGSSSSPRIHSLLVAMFWFCYRRDIRWSCCWLPRELNELADQLSRLVDEDDWILSPHYWGLVSLWVAPCSFTVDQFASPSRHLLPRFCSLTAGPGVLRVNCYTLPWADEFSWWNPHPREVPFVLAKVRREGAQGCLLCSGWVGASWWRLVCPDGAHFGPMVVDWFALDNPREAFVAGEGSGVYNRQPPHCPLFVLRLDGARASHPFAPSRAACSQGGCPRCGASQGV